MNLYAPLPLERPRSLSSPVFTPTFQQGRGSKPKLLFSSTMRNTRYRHH
ncbi:hypothetical protein ACHAXS_010481 [Conticribra weissflogii]